MTTPPNPPASDPSEALFDQVLDLPGGATFSINGFLDSLDAAADRLLAEGGRAQHALQVGAGEASAGPVTVKVNAAGQLLAVGFTDEMAQTSTTGLNRHFMRALTDATRSANQGLSSAMGGSVGSLIAQAAPPAEDDLPGAPPARPELVEAPAPAPGEAPPLEMPKDPVLDEWFSMLDDIDPAHFAEGLEKMLQAAPFEVPDLTGKTGAQIDAEFAAENQRISDNVMALQPELQALEVTVVAKAVDVSVNAAGVVTGVSFHAPALGMAPAELATELLATWGRAGAEAAQQTHELLARGGVGTDDPSLALLQPPTPTVIDDEPEQPR
ncbi:hypothetical protein ACPCG0_05635 [Propionibacteriaceae bacterium Y1923]